MHFNRSKRNILWICYTCHRKILKGKVPEESFANNLLLDDIPVQLKQLNQLEHQLISLTIPFMKIVALPKGGQKAVHGPCVCVPSDISKVTNTLPRFEDDSCIVAVKLKRKLEYKGYEQYQLVDTKHITDALLFLKEHNQWYSNVQLNLQCGIDAKLNDYFNDNEENRDTVTTDLDNNDGENKRESETENDVVEREIHKTEADSYLNDNLRSVQLDTCLQPADIGQEALDFIFDKEFSISPAEGNTPVSVLREKGLEAKTFPYLYPTGNNTFDKERDQKLSLLRYFNLRLMSVENRFAMDTCYIFFSQYMSELDRVMSNVQISLRKQHMYSKGQKVTRKMLCNKKELNELFKKDEAIKYMKPVRGTPAYWQSTQKDIFAMIRQLGIPTFFASFSSADFRWTEIAETIMDQQGDNRKLENLSFEEQCKVLRSNPVTVTRMFDHRFQIFF